MFTSKTLEFLKRLFEAIVSNIIKNTSLSKLNSLVFHFKRIKILKQTKKSTVSCLTSMENVF